jgi:hypothetical protein
MLGATIKIPRWLAWARAARANFEKMMEYAT